MNIKVVPDHLVKFIWPECLELLIARPRHLLDVNDVKDYLPFLEKNQMQLWIVSEKNDIIATMITEIQSGKGINVLNIIAFASEKLKSFVSDLDQALVAFCQDNQCAGYEGIMRPGFSKMLPQLVEDGRLYVRMVNDV